MPWKNIDKINFRDPHQGVPLEEIQPLSERAYSHIARCRNDPLLKRSFVNIYGAVEMMRGLTYHHASFMKLIESCRTTTPSFETTDALRHEAVAYLNRLGQFWSFSNSRLVKDFCSSPEKALSTISKLIVFRNKHAAHRSIDSPRTEDTDGLQVMNAISLSELGGKLFHPKPEHTPINITSEPLNTDEDFNTLKRNFYGNYYFGFQIYDITHSEHVNFFLERDHDLIMPEAYSLINKLLPLPTPTT